MTRPTVRVRSWIRPQLESCTTPGFDATSPYVRRFWTAAIGPTAVADLLRLMAAARTGTAIPLPRRTHVLLGVGLLSRTPDGDLVVLDRVPLLSEPLARRLPPRLKRIHPLWARAASSGRAAA